MSRIRILTLKTCAAGCLLILGLTGCAGTSKIQLPWQKSTATSRPTHDEKADEATNRAQRALSEAREIAWANGLRAAAEDEASFPPDSFDEASTRSLLAEPHGEWTGPIREAEMTATRRNEGRTDQTSRNGNGSSPDGDGNTTVAAVETTTETGTGGSSLPPLRSIDRSEAKARRAPESMEWPLALPSNDVPERDRLTVADPSHDAKIYELGESEHRSHVAETYEIDPPSSEDAVAIPGTYVTDLKDFDEFENLDDEAVDNQIAVIRPGTNVAIYAGGEEIASLDVSSEHSLPAELDSVRPVRVVRDGTTQLLFFWTETPDDTRKEDDESDKSDEGDEDTVEYKVGLLKVIGPFVGKIFEGTVATSNGSKADLEKSAYLEFLRGDDHHLIRWTPADEEEKPAIDETKLLQWNPWEGVYRVPKPPPTQPDQRS